MYFFVASSVRFPSASNRVAALLIMTSGSLMARMFKRTKILAETVLCAGYTYRIFVRLSCFYSVRSLLKNLGPALLTVISGDAQVSIKCHRSLLGHPDQVCT